MTLIQSINLPFAVLYELGRYHNIPVVQVDRTLRREHAAMLAPKHLAKFNPISEKGSLMTWTEIYRRYASTTSFSDVWYC